MIIKRIDEKSYLDVVDLYNDYRIFYQQPSDLALADNFLKERMVNGESIIFAAYVDDKAAGFTQLFANFSTVRALKRYVMADLFVTDNFRKKGIGTELIKEAINFAKANRGKAIRLSTEIDNTTAQNLYESLGFKSRTSNGLKDYEIKI